MWGPRVGRPLQLVTDTVSLAVWHVPQCCCWQHMQCCKYNTGCMCGCAVQPGLQLSCDAKPWAALLGKVHVPTSACTIVLQAQEVHCAATQDCTLAHTQCGRRHKNAKVGCQPLSAPWGLQKALCWVRGTGGSVCCVLADMQSMMADVFEALCVLTGVQFVRHAVLRVMQPCARLQEFFAQLFNNPCDMCMRCCACMRGQLREQCWCIRRRLELLSCLYVCVYMCISRCSGCG